MKSALTAVAIMLASVSAWGSQNPNYQFTFVTQTGQTIEGHQIAALGSPALNNAGDVIFTGYEKAPIGSSTFLAGLFSPQRLVAPYNGSLPACIGSYFLNDSGKIAFAQNTKLTPVYQSVSGVYETSLSGGPVKTIAAPGQVINGVQLITNICIADNSIGDNFSFDDSGRIIFGDSGGLYVYTPEKGLTNPTITDVHGQPVSAVIPIGGTSEEFLFSAFSGTTEGIFTPHRVVVETGDRIDGIELTGFGGPYQSSRRGLAFEASYGPPGESQQGIFTRKSVVVKNGQKIDGKLLAITLEFDVNDEDQVVFSGLFGGGVYPNDIAIATRDEIIAAVGDTINGHTVTFLGTPVLNDCGMVAFLATFSDGSQAIVKAIRKWKR